MPRIKDYSISRMLGNSWSKEEQGGYTEGVPFPQQNWELSFVLLEYIPTLLLLNFLSFTQQY